jgi:hypothetical protein
MKSIANQNVIFSDDEVRVIPSPTNVGYRVLLSDVDRRRRPRSGATITVAMALIGLLAGWIGGIALTGGFRNSKTASEPVDVAAPSQPPTDSGSTSTEKLVTAPASKQLRPREAPDQSLQPRDADPRADKQEGDEREVEKPVIEPPRKEPSKEVGQDAMEKMLRDNEKVKRGKRLKANRNDGDQ